MENKDFQSIFNDGVFQIKRIDTLWSKIHSYRRNGQLIDIKWELDSIFNELWVDLFQLKQETRAEYEKRYSELRILLNIAENKKDWAAYYDCLNRLERLVKEIYVLSGKAGKYEDIEDAGFFS